MKALALLFTSATLLTTTATAQLIATVESFDSKSITLSFSGTLSGTAPDLSANSLFFQAPGIDWLSATSSLSFSGEEPISGSSLSFTVSSSNFLGGFGDYFSLTFANNLISGSTTGTGNLVTLTSASDLFNPAAVNNGSDLQLAWGINTGETTQPFGVFQSNVVGVPEPTSTSLLALSGLALALRRRRA